MADAKEPTRETFESGRRAMSQISVRQANARAVLTAIAFNSGASNAEISRLSGLAPQTVSAILVDLEQAGLILRGPVLRGRRGQPATPIYLNADGGLAIGVELGWRHLKVVLLNMHARVVRSHHVDYNFPDASTIVDAIFAGVEDVSRDVKPAQRARLLDLGIARPARFAGNMARLGFPAEQDQLWADLNLVEALEARTGLSVTLHNDGNAGCWAELIAMPRPRPANVIYLLVSHFIAAGIVGDGTLWEGPTGTAAELGSILVSRVGKEPEVAQRVASLWALRQLVNGSDPKNDSLSYAELAAPERMADIEIWLDAAAPALAQVIFNASTVVEQPLVVLGTLLSPELSAGLVERVEVELGRLPVRILGLPRVVPGQLGTLGPAMGAAELPLFRRYF